MAHYMYFNSPSKYNVTKLTVLKKKFNLQQDQIPIFRTNGQRREAAIGLLDNSSSDKETPMSSKLASI